MKLEQATAWSLLPILLLTILSLVTVPIYYHSFGPEMYALWFAVQTMTGSFGFMDLGMGVATGRFVGVAIGRGDFAAAREYWASGNLVNLGFLGAMALIFGLLGSFGGAQWFQAVQFDHPVFLGCIWASAAGLFVNYYSQGWQILLQAHLEFRWLSINRSLFSLVAGIGMATLASQFHNPFPSILFGVGLGVLQLASLMARAHHQHQMGPSLKYARWARLKEMFSYTGKTFLSLMSGSVLGSLDRWVLGRVAGAAPFVSYNVASNLASRAQGLSVAVMGPIFHESSRGVGRDDMARLADIYRRSFTLLAPIYILPSLWITFWQSPWLVLWLGPELGAKVSVVLPFLIWAASLSALANISGAQLGPLNMVGTGTMIQSISWACSGLLVWAGWQLHGLEGSAAGLLAGRVVLFFQDALVRRKIHVCFPGTRLWIMVGAAALLCWLTHWGGLLWAPSGMGPAVISLICAGGLGLIGWFTWPNFRIHDAPHENRGLS